MIWLNDCYYRKWLKITRNITIDRQENLNSNQPSIIHLFHHKSRKKGLGLTTKKACGSDKKDLLQQSLHA